MTRARGLVPALVVSAWVLAAAVPAGAQVTAAPAPSVVEGLPDGRSFELVSPPQKYGGQVIPMRYEGSVVQAAQDGSAISYVLNAPTIENPAGNPLFTQELSTRTSGGWDSQDISIPGEEVFRVGVGLAYRAFTPDLSQAIVWPDGESLALAPEVPSQLTTDVYSRDLSTGAYRALVTSAPPLQVPIEESGATRSGRNAEIRFVGATADMKHVILSSYLALTPNAHDAELVRGEGNLYEWSAAEGLKLVNILPDGSATVGFAGLGENAGQVVRNAISPDGSRVIWTYAEGTSSELFVRDMASEQTVQVDASQGGAESGGEGVFQTASADGSRIFFTDKRELTADANTGGPHQGKGGAEEQELYVYDSSSGILTDISSDRTDHYGAQVQTVFGASDNGSYVYFVARGVLASGATAGQNNLYLARYDSAGWTTSFIGTLSQQDATGFVENVGAGNDLDRLSARVSPNGRFTAFMSNRPLTGYDNRDVSSGLPDEEVYLYDATTERLVCASCNPLGVRPSGKVPALEFSPTDPLDMWAGVALAAVIPGWTPTELASARYQSRYLSDEGRLFFDSFDSLVPHDVNGTADVYEYEPVGVGGCGATIGCVALVSGGLGPVESAFMDASVTGNDVFFMTSDRLAAQDRDTSYDVYDAHVCSAGAPCVGSVVQSPPCSTGDACKPAPSPQPSVFGDPASATFAGAGNVVEPVATGDTKRGGAKVKARKRRRIGKGKHGKRRARKAGRRVGR